MLEACIERSNDLKLKRDEINRHGEDLKRLLIDELRKIHKDIESLDTVKVQIQMTINQVEAQEKVLMN
jgi:hypothetical protein